MMSNQPSYSGRVKYDAKTASEYRIRPTAKHRAEMRLIDKAFHHIPKTDRVLDLPCGAGRVSLHLAHRGYRMSCADYSEAMLALTRQALAKEEMDFQVVKQDIEHLSYPDQAFDTVICFRLFHHFPTPEVRRQAVSELCRVARRHVVISYLSPIAVNSMKLKLRAWLGIQKMKKFSTPLREVTGYFERAGYRLVKDYAQLPVVHTLHLAVFERMR